MLKVKETETYSRWIDGLKDIKGRARINARIVQLTRGNPGDSRRLSGGITELRISYGPGYRVYYIQQGEEIIILLAGGDKSTQDRDIQKARRLASEY